MKTLFQTRDGDMFDTAASAEQHENELFEQWLNNVAAGDVAISLTDLVTFVGRLPDTENSELYGTTIGMLRDILKIYWSAE